MSPQQVFSVANAVALHGTVLITGASSGIGRMMLEKPEPVLKVNDQDEVARTRRDCEKTLRDLLDEFESVRTDSVTFVKKLKTEDLDCGSIHAKTGHITVRELLHEWVYHDLNHVSQINANFQRFLLNHLGGMQQFYQS